MEMASNTEVEYDRRKEVMEFDETRAGVKGLVDSGITKIPRMFHHPTQTFRSSVDVEPPWNLKIPVIDFQGLDSGKRAIIIDEIRRAAEKEGFFQIVNHSVPIKVMKDMLDGVKSFHELPKEEKMALYTRDAANHVRYFSNNDLLASRAACWRDTILLDVTDGLLDTESQVPYVIRKPLREYMKCILTLKETLSEMISEALGLRPDYLAELGCMETALVTGHYYPMCPEPDLTVGSLKHSDPSFLTVLLQDSVGGLQVLHQDHWVDVTPVQWSLVINMGDLMQLISNGKFRSVEHRVLVRRGEPRVSIGCFFRPSSANKSKPYGPIMELLSDDSPPMYRETSICEYLACYASQGKDGNSALLHFQSPQYRLRSKNSDPAII